MSTPCTLAIKWCISRSWSLISGIWFAVVYLDADTIVVQSVEDLFKCRKFCANLKHSERLNSGVMVVEPSQTVFNDMMSKVKTLSSYTGGKNSYFYNIIYPHCLYFLSEWWCFFSPIIMKTICFPCIFHWDRYIEVVFFFMWILCTGDQGFLNSYYSGFSNAHVFEPNLPPEKLKSKPAPEMERLSTLYNADVGLYMLANKVLNAVMVVINLVIISK